MAWRGGGGWRGSGGRGGDHRGHGIGGRRGGGGQRTPYGYGRGGAGGYQQPPYYGRGRYQHQQPPYGRGVGADRGPYQHQQPLGRGRGAGGGQGRGSVEAVEPRVRPAAPVVPAAASSSPTLASASSSAWAPAPPASAAAASSPSTSAAASSSSSAWAPAPPAPAAAASTSAPASASSSATATALARGVGSLAVEDTATPAPAASTSAAPALRPEAPPLSSKGNAPPARPGSGTLGTKLHVRANHFLVEVEDIDICHYNVSVTPEPKARRTNRVLLLEIVKVHGATDLANKKPAYDGSKSLYTASELPFKSRDFVVKLGKEGREIEYKVTIQYASRANLHHLQKFLHGQQRDSPQAIIQALDVVLRESPSLKYVTVSRSFFSEVFDGEKDIGGGLECWRGYYQSLRPTQMGLSLNIDVCSTAFYKSISVVQFVEKCLGVTNHAQPFSDSDRLKIKKALRGVRVETTHQQGKTSIYKITGITSIPLEDLKFIWNEGHQITVVQYFEQRYSYRLRCTTWPCLQSGSDSKPIYLPMEVCKIIAGQKYPRKLSDAQVANILKETCKGPQDREKIINDMVGQNNYSTDKLAESFQITVANQMANVSARVLPPPMLKYHESGKKKTVVPNNGQWNVFGKEMVKGGKVRSWTCINFSWLRPGLVRSILEGLVRACNSIGMDFNEYPVTEVKSASTDRIEDALRDVHNNNPNLELLVVIIPKDKGHYGKIKKLCETDLGIVSQCINPEPKKTYKYFANIALKINVKVGGRNTVLESAFMRNGMPFLSNIPTIIFGADVTHPVAGDDSSASIAAVVASMDWPEVTTYKALISAQAHRQEIIQNLFCPSTDPEKGTQVDGGMIMELLLSFYKRNNKKKPSRIIFYRDGVSEGQFSQVLLHEMYQIRKACTSLEANYVPGVTFVVVQKRHHTRLFPDTSGNVPPGTVVDTDICHPSEFDFYLCSHAGIQGTSRPAHYHVLYDDNGFSADEMQTLTNDLCYTYARCTRAVSVVPPVYYAHLAASRARCYDEQAEGNDGGPPGLRMLPQVKDNVKEVMFFC